VARRTERRLRAEIKTVRSGLKDTDRLANVSRLVSGLAQDLKSPLQGVLSNAEVLAATEKLDEEDATWSGDLDACRRVLETHGATLEVERRPTGGFGCRLELPVTAAAGAGGV